MFQASEIRVYRNDQRMKRFCEEMKVFEDSQRSQINQKAHQKGQLRFSAKRKGGGFVFVERFSAVLKSGNQYSGAVIYHCGKKDQKPESPIPGHVEQIGGKE